MCDSRRRIEVFGFVPAAKLQAEAIPRRRAAWARQMPLMAEASLAEDSSRSALRTPPIEQLAVQAQTEPPEAAMVPAQPKEWMQG